MKKKNVTGKNVKITAVIYTRGTKPYSMEISENDLFSSENDERKRS